MSTYQTPTITELGSVADFTRGNFLGFESDGGTIFIGKFGSIDGKCTSGTGIDVEPVWGPCS